VSPCAAHVAIRCRWRGAISNARRLGYLPIGRCSTGRRAEILETSPPERADRRGGIMSLETAIPQRRPAGAEAHLVSPPPRSAVRAAYAAAAAAIIGFIPLHAIWALGIPLFADAELFRAWHENGGGVYLLTLNLLAVLPAVLAIALIRPWGLVFPRWVPVFGGHRVPRMLLIAPGAGLSVSLLAYTVFAAVLMPAQWGDPAAIFDARTGIYGIGQFLIWIAGLAIATHSYAHRTSPRMAAGRSRRCGGSRATSISGGSRSGTA
jgi:hypothetical protein